MFQILAALLNKKIIIKYITFFNFIYYLISTAKNMSYKNNAKVKLTYIKKLNMEISTVT